MAHEKEELLLNYDVILGCGLSPEFTRPYGLTFGKVKGEYCTKHDFDLKKTRRFLNKGPSDQLNLVENLHLHCILILNTCRKIILCCVSVRFSYQNCEKAAVF
jgi:hypothetical protein